MKRSFKHLLGHSLVGIPKYNSKYDLEFPPFENAIAITEGELNNLLEDAMYDYRKSLVDAVENRQKVVMVNLYESLYVSMKVYDSWWLTLQDNA